MSGKHRLISVATLLVLAGAGGRKDSCCPDPARKSPIGKTARTGEAC